MDDDRTHGEPGLFGVGYEGRTIDELVHHLITMGISRLVDVRLTPISRKPGLSKTALGRALADAGIAYEHRRELGNPKANRAGFSGTAAELTEARASFAALLARSESADALADIARAGQRQRVAVLCFEASQAHCHCDVVLREAQRMLATA